MVPGLLDQNMPGDNKFLLLTLSDIIFVIKRNKGVFAYLENNWCLGVSQRQTFYIKMSPKYLKVVWIHQIM